MSEQIRPDVAFFIHGFEVGGAQRRTIQLAGALASRGLGVALLVADDGGPVRGEVPDNEPVIDADFARRVAEPATHPWLADGGDPVIASAGRLGPLVPPSDFAVLAAAMGFVLETRPGPVPAMRASPPREANTLQFSTATILRCRRVWRRRSGFLTAIPRLPWR